MVKIVMMVGMVNARNALAQAKLPGGGGITIPQIAGNITGGGGGGSTDFQNQQTGETGEGTLTDDLLNPPTDTGERRVTVLASDITRVVEENEQSVSTSQL